MNELHLFAGAGGGILGGMLLGHRPVCAVELDPFCRQVLLQRQRDGLLPWFPIWDDVKSFRGDDWRGRVRLVAGGFPCQDIAAQGTGEGISGAWSGLWKEFARIVGEVQPEFVFIENSPLLVSRGLGTVLADLHALGFDAEWGCVTASEAGLHHRRKRIWILAHSMRYRLEGGTEFGHQEGWLQLLERVQALVQIRPWSEVSNPRAFGNGDGMAHRVDRLKAIGNGQVPQTAAMAFQLLHRRLTEN